MPELPEVETISRQLAREIVGKKIVKTEINFKKPIGKLSVSEFRRLTEEANITDVGRRAKLVLIYLSNGQVMLVHLKMTGRLLVAKKDDNKNKHTHIVFNFQSGDKLFFEDWRKFGYVKVIPEKSLEEFFEQEKYGPEPLDKKFTVKVLKDLLAKKAKKKIKPLLMDQTFIAGVGNIYAAEACFCAGILPERLAGKIKDAEVKKLYSCLIKILKLAISKHGSSVEAYVDAEGKKGGYVPFLKVYGRAGKKCFRCKGTIKEIRLGGRSTGFCPHCQK
jgi:formamidopyrimidine-DNA glycosylase